MFDNDVATTNRAGAHATAISFALACLALYASPARAETNTLIAQVKAPTPIATHGDRVVWSEYDPDAKSYRLMTRVKGVNTAVPVNPRPIPFDVDLGPDKDGNTMAVYSRCVKEPDERFFMFSQDWMGAKGCQLYRYDFASAQEGRLPVKKRPKYSQVQPSIYGSKVAYAEFSERMLDLPTDPDAYPKGYRYKRIPGEYVYVQALDGGKPQLQPQSREGLCNVGYPAKGKECAKISRDILINSLNLSSKYLAVSRYINPIPSVKVGETTQIQLNRVGSSRAHIIAKSKGGIAIREPLWPTVDNDYLYWAQPCSGGECLLRQQGFFRYQIATRKLERADTGYPLGAFERVGSSTFALHQLTDGGNGCDPGYPGSAKTCDLNQVDGLLFTPTTAD